MFFHTSDDNQDRWFHEDYFYHGGNLRYYTFLSALGMLYQRFQKEGGEPVIIETGCQRQEEDVGAGMSTTIFARYTNKYGGRIVTVDNNAEHLGRAMEYIEKLPDTKIEFVLADSVEWLRTYQGPCDFLYLDSLDYPVGKEAENLMMQERAQGHCLDECRGLLPRLGPKTIILADDNQFPGGGKPRKLKEFLSKEGFTCILDLQQSLWIKEL